MQNTNYTTVINLIAQITKAGLPVNEFPVEVGSTPLIITTNTAFNVLPLMIYGNILSKVFYEHGITAPVLHRLYTLLETPVAIYNSESTIKIKGSIVIATTEMMKGGTERLIVALQPDINVGHKRINRIGSIYGKNLSGIQGWENRGLRIWP